VVSNYQLKIYFLLKTINLIDIFFSSAIVGIDPIDVFSPSVSTYGSTISAWSYSQAAGGGRIATPPDPDCLQASALLCTTKSAWMENLWGLIIQLK
jgi:hypothetical protein